SYKLPSGSTTGKYSWLGRPTMDIWNLSPPPTRYRIGSSELSIVPPASIPEFRDFDSMSPRSFFRNSVGISRAFATRPRFNRVRQKKVRYKDVRNATLKNPFLRVDTGLLDAWTDKLLKLKSYGLFPWNPSRDSIPQIQHRFLRLLLIPRVEINRRDILDPAPPLQAPHRVRRLELLQGPIVAGLPEEQHSPLQPDVGLLDAGLHRLLQGEQGQEIVPFALMDAGDAQVVLRAFGVYEQTLLVSAHGLAIVLSQFVQLPQVEVQLGGRRGQDDQRLVHDLDRAGVVADARIRLRHGQIDVGLIGFDFQGGLEMLEGFRNVAGLEGEFAQHLMGMHVRAVDFQDP